jgi:hypothetical protein
MSGCDRLDRVGTRFMTGEKAGQLGLGPDDRVFSIFAL